MKAWRLGGSAERSPSRTFLYRGYGQGFHDVVDSEAMFVRLLRRFREERIVP